MKRYIKSAANESRTGDFEIKNGVLMKYRGNSKNVVVPDGVKSIGEYCFSKSDIVNIEFPAGLTDIQSGAFFMCKNIQNIELPSTLKRLGPFAFSRCENLTSVNIPESVSVIWTGCFEECKNLTYVKLPSKLQSIRFRAFAECTNLTKIDIPDTVTEIDNCAFEDCINLEKVSMPDIEISKIAFRGCVKLDKTNFRYYDPNKNQTKKTKTKRKARPAEYDSIHEWYMSSDGERDNDEFAETLEDLVKRKFDVSDYFEEPSIQGFAGNDYIDIELGDGSKYSFAFSWSEMQENIFEDGPDKAAKHYFNEIKEGIESGSASTDTPTL